MDGLRSLRPQFKSAQPLSGSHPPRRSYYTLPDLRHVPEVGWRTLWVVRRVLLQLLVILRALHQGCRSVQS